MMIAYSCGLYSEPRPNWRDGPIRPLLTYVSSAREQRRTNFCTHQTALAVKNTWLCGHVRWFSACSVHMPLTCVNIQTFTLTWITAAKDAATSCAGTASNQIRCEKGEPTYEGGPRWHLDIVPQLQILHEVRSRRKRLHRVSFECLTVHQLLSAPLLRKQNSPYSPGAFPATGFLEGSGRASSMRSKHRESAPVKVSEVGKAYSLASHSIYEPRWKDVYHR